VKFSDILLSELATDHHNNHARNNRICWVAGFLY